MKIELAGETASARLGEALARTLVAPESSPPQGMQLDLRGSLGAGKTTLIRGLLRALGVTGTVRSPTYTLIEPYEASGWRLMHYDLYRISEPEELELLGAREHFERGVLRCVEWPQRAGGWLPAGDLVVALSGTGDSRLAELVAGSDVGGAWLADLGAYTLK